MWTSLPRGTEVWIRTVDLVRLKDDIVQNRSPLINATHKTSLPKLYEARAACMYKPDGKCIGMMTPECFHLKKCSMKLRETNYTEICLLLLNA
jgi:hypothetical protein